nr:immunoglobulin heavy chain junction region [Mus musculus]MBK4189318.1 immunoglobulin heavy chain junction region [Mus musculus]MBK4189319.1 immunoglobulin heavy chain junction region [Mus musculus]MBK4189320.1 immunoglobulin heavy chain junction region [Mus musculus]
CARSGSNYWYFDVW